MIEQQRITADDILARAGNGDPAKLIAVLQEVQKEERYLPKDVLQYVAAKMEVPLTRVYTIATFYKSFSLKPRGRHQVKVCTGTACHIKGAACNCREITRRLGIFEGETTADLNFSVETVNCLGTCALAPVIVVDDDYFDGVTPAKVRRILKQYSNDDQKQQ